VPSLPTHPQPNHCVLEKAPGGTGAFCLPGFHPATQVGRYEARLLHFDEAAVLEALKGRTAE